jgi:hypothetical protein
MATTGCSTRAGLVSDVGTMRTLQRPLTFVAFLVVLNFFLSEAD